MKKSEIPKPKYGLGDTVIFNVPGDGNYTPRRDVGTIDKITITMTRPYGYSIRYGFVDKDDDTDESSITRRVLAAQSRV